MLSLPVRTKGNSSDSDNIKDQTGRMYFQTPFPVPSQKQLSAKFLHHWEGLRSFCSMPDFCHHNYFGHWGAWMNFDQDLSLFDKIVNFAFNITQYRDGLWYFNVGKQLFLRWSCFVEGNRENSSILGTTKHMNTKLAPMCYWGPVDFIWSPYHKPSL